jgi:hypothetical protein
MAKKETLMCVAYSAQFGQAFRSIPAGYSGHCGRGRSEATLEFFS